MEKKILQLHNTSSRFLARKSRRMTRGAWLLATTSILGLGIVAGCGNNGGGGATAGGGGTVEIKPETALAVVGDQTINKAEMYSLLEANYGPSALTQLIDYTLLMQKAKSEGITISEDEVQKGVDERAKTNPQVAEVEKKGGAALDALKRQVRLQATVDALLTKDIKVDPKAYDEWLKKNQSKYAVPERVKIGILFASTKARADVLAQQLKTGKSFADLVKAQKETKDPMARNSVADITEAAPKTDPNGGYLAVKDLEQGMQPVQTALTKLKADQSSEVISLGGQTPAFVIVKLLDRKEGTPVKGDDPKPQSEYKLEQVARGLTKENPSNPNFEQTVTQVEQSLQQQGMQSGRFEAPTYRQVLDYINQTAVQKLLTSLRSGTKVEIKDPMYSEVADSYKPEPTPVANAGAPGGAVPPAGGADNAAAPAADNSAAAPVENAVR